MKSKRISTPPVSDRWSFLWLIVGAVLLMLSTGRFGVAIAAWLTPAFLIRFFRSQNTGRGYLLILLGIYVADAISWSAIFAFFGLPVFLIFNIFIALMNSLPYLADRLLAPRIKGFAATLVYPLAVTTMFYLYNLVSLIGSFGTLGYEQYTNLSLVQIVSVTGLWGLILLVSWFGPVANWAWEHSFNLLQIRRGLAIWAGIVGVVMIFGGLRLAFARLPAGTVRVHGFIIEQTPEMEITEIDPNAPDNRRALQVRHDALVADTIREARRGAQVVLWNEGAGGGVEEDARALIARAQEVAQQENIYIAMGLWVFFPDQQRPWENKLVVVAPSGETIIDHNKYGATFMYSLMDYGEAFQGDLTLQTAQTPYGTLTGGVCWDADFPMIMRQAGRKKADILLVSNGDPDPGPITVLHTQQQIFRAIENGVSLVRQDDERFSVATDPYGRLLASVDLSTASEPVLMAQVPTHGVFTIYSVIGDFFGWLSVVGFVFVAGWAIFRGRKSSTEDTNHASD